MALVFGSITAFDIAQATKAQLERSKVVTVAIPPPFVSKKIVLENVKAQQIQIERTLASFDAAYAVKRAEKPRVVRKLSQGRFAYRYLKGEEAIKYRARQACAQAKVVEQEREFHKFLETEHTVSQIHSYITMNVRETTGEGITGVKWPAPVKRAERRKIKRVRTPRVCLENLVGAITNIVKRKQACPIEIIGTKRNTVRVVQHEGRKYVQVHLAHMTGLKPQRDVIIPTWNMQLLLHIAKRVTWNYVHSNRNVRPGMSGFVLQKRKLQGSFSSSVGEAFIVRGNYKGTIYDARRKMSKELVLGMRHYTSVGDVFWRGFNKTFLEHRVIPEHQCTSNLSVEDCGSVSALLCQIIYPCGRITCLKCVQEFCDLSEDEVCDRILSNLRGTKGEALRSFSSFQHVGHIMKMLPRINRADNPNYEAFADITRMMNDRKEAPVSHINKLNELLIKGGSATSNDYKAAHEHLREIARYHKNRTENIKKGCLSSFRNKVSSKTMINPVLLCDNQRDKNGNFLWGERGYHAKRFFNNFFEVVRPEDGYDKYMVREFPNGTRKLAIGNLIVPTNFEALRRHMVGEQVEPFDLGQHCVSKMNSNFVYPCCCVTNEDGTPQLTDTRAPTKHHLVVGNTGDAKYIDLPETDNQQMYIAKAGYCYINIFLAMLVNVDEGKAKDFTKMVRDKIVPQLGKWPMAIDVATACYMLTIFCPGTQSAELPKIFLDHKTKTMHVIDSYGSQTTGYHILKANTVSQFIQFASDAMESEMKHYAVGGCVDDLAQVSVNKLVRAVYRPRMMEQLLLEEPYALLCALVSPTILMAMYNSGSFEKAIHYLGTKNMNLSSLINLYASLARKVSGSKCVISQYQILESNASSALSLIEQVPDASDGRARAYMLLETMATQMTADLELVNQGYATFRNETKRYLEKTYARALQDSWDALSLREKFLSTRDCRKWFVHIGEQVVPQESPDLTTASVVCWNTPFGIVKRMGSAAFSYTCEKISTMTLRARTSTTRLALGTARFFAPDLMNCLTFSLILTTLLSIIGGVRAILQSFHSLQQMKANIKAGENQKRINKLYREFVKGKEDLPHTEEFISYVAEICPDLNEPLLELIYGKNFVRLQAKKECEVELERVIAFMALVMMVFDNERSDYVHRALSKVKSLMSSIDSDVKHQALDDIKDEFSERNLHVDFELDGDVVPGNMSIDHTFKMWWANQIERNNVIPHYRTGGHFMEFTRKTAAHVANTIAHGPHKEILLRGAVGSGKSTGLPYHLYGKGGVLLIEPTRPLAENVSRQLHGEPFNVSPTLRMRGMSTFGSTPITIMTSGFALHYCANNPLTLQEYAFIIIDECHVNDSNAMAFVGLLHMHNFEGKLIKVSATPPGREVEFTTEFAVTVKPEESLSFQQFVQAQGTGANADVIQHGNNILIYVASYNEVDKLSKQLIDKGYDVTKVDGRTMKLGNVSIKTHGTSMKKHFIVATNIIENGVTLDVDVVVDFGTKVTPNLDIDNRCIRYSITSISYGERIQRLGRVGRFQKGTALRIGWTEKGLLGIPEIVATEAAFLSFVYGLPIMTQNVTTSILANCTVRQARTMLQFELSPFYMVDLVRFDGSMHPAIHNVLKKYKLRESEIILNKLAIPSSKVCMWLSAREYGMVGTSMELEPDVKLPFKMRDIPDLVHKNIWECVLKYKADSGFGRISSASACKIAYTLQTDLTAIPRTLNILDALIVQETEKQAYFKAVTTSSSVRGGFSLDSIVQKIRSRYAHDYSTENLGVLHAAKAQIQEFNNLRDDATFGEVNRHLLNHEIEKHGALRCVQHQGVNEVACELALKGRWNKSLVTQDLFLLVPLFVGGVWMTYTYFKNMYEKKVYHQGFNKRQRQKLKFQKARDEKLGKEVYGDDGVMTHYFGNAYEKKAKLKGVHTKGMGTARRKFVNMYGFDPTEYSFVRYLDPLTGNTIDESPITDIKLVQDHFSEVRILAIQNGDLDPLYLGTKPGIEAYYIKNLATAALKVDLTPHNPRLMCKNSNSIAKFPEREFELRQTGAPVSVDASRIPAENEFNDEVAHEAKSLFRGLRDYNAVASVVCRLENNSDGVKTSIFGIGYGGLIITNQHLLQRNNGELRVISRHGDFLIRNTTTMSVFPCKGYDLMIIRMPKDFPPFPQRIRFRLPEQNEKICMVGSNFQDKSISSMISESSITVPEIGSKFWKHWIDTKDGQCGLPLVSTRDGFIIGIHSLASNYSTVNYFANLPGDFENSVLKTPENLAWVQGWKYNENEVCWGGLKLTRSMPCGLFKTSKLVTDLADTSVRVQANTDNWVECELKGNLKAVARCPGNLVTKHTYKGKCALFNLYLSTHPEELEYFKPKLGAYQKSRLNKAAYLNDIMKYSTTIEVGVVDTTLFEQTLDAFEEKLRNIGFEDCVYVLDQQAIFDSLNMKSAVGALYGGKKRDYFKDFQDSDKSEILKQSCERLYTGQFGVWNGSLKAELRPKEKVELNKTRTFTAAPLDTLLGGKACVDDFNNQFYNFHLKGPWSVGMTKFFKGWDRMLKLLPDGWVYCDADGSQFDSSLSPYLLNAILELRLRFIEEWDIGEKMLSNLYTEIIYTPIATPDGTIIKKFKGNNSGQPSTVVDNTLMVILVLMHSLRKEGIPFDEQDNVCRYFVNGDDLLLAVEPAHEHILDRLAQDFLEFGLKYDFTSRSRDKGDVWFMSQRGHLIDDMYIPKLEEERIVSILEWDRSVEPQHRLEAICASMIEAWGHTRLLHEIRKFYAWVLEQAPYSEIAKMGGAPYISETALRRLYTLEEVADDELLRYLDALYDVDINENDMEVRHQSGETVDAGRGTQGRASSIPSTGAQKDGKQTKDKDQDVDVGTTGLFTIPRFKSISGKMRAPQSAGKVVMNLDHLLRYEPEQTHLYNTRSTQKQFDEWYKRVTEEYEVDENGMSLLLNGLMVWCIENGTSPNINGVWVMMDGSEQVEYPIRPLIEHAKPTFRQIMAHFSNMAEAYIEMRNSKQPYMPRYGLQRNLRDFSLARYAFDFYEITSRTPDRAREAHLQMKAAALKNVENKMFGLDGNVSTKGEDTERHTTDDVNAHMHNMLGVRM